MCFAPNFIKKNLLDTKDQIGPDTIIVDDFHTPILSIDRSSGPKKTQYALELKCTIDSTAITDTYSMFYPTPVKYTFFLAAH
jgi:hypothetical protein